MSVRVISSDVNDRTGVVIVEADAQHEVQSAAARQAAIAEGVKKGLSGPGVSGDGGAYPVDDAGNTGDDVLMGRKLAVAYRCDYRLTARL